MNLRDLRTSAGKTVKETAAALGVTRSAITNYEAGIRLPNIAQVLILTELYDCSERDVIEAALNSQNAR